MFGQPLFRDAELATYLRQREALIEPRVAKHVEAKDLARPEEDVVAELVKLAAVKPLNVDFDNRVEETTRKRITTSDNFYGRVEIEGICATRSFAFTGDPAVFGMRPSPWTDVARGEILDGALILGAEGEKDGEPLRQELDRQEANLRELVAHSTAQIDQHNDTLAARTAEAVARRREHLQEVENFRKTRR